jgi:HK97 family phage major capsid protein
MLRKLQIRTKEQRNINFTDSKDLIIDVENRTVVFPFSSEAPVKRTTEDGREYQEIIVHDTNSFDFSRLADGAAVLEEHKPPQIGVVEKAWLGDDKRGWVLVRFSKSKHADEIFQDIVDGIRRNVSFGYEIVDYEPLFVEDELKVLITRVLPFEVSIVAIPADAKVGIRRSEGDTEESGIQTIEIEKPVEIEVIKTQEIVVVEENTKTLEENKNMNTLDSKMIKEILAIGNRFGMQAEAQMAIEKDMTVEDFKTLVIEKQGEKAKSEAIKTQSIGMREDEKRNFSFIKALRFLADPSDEAARKEAKFEIEVSRAYADKVGKNTSGLVVPPEVIYRDFNLTTGTGSNLVATNLRADMFIDLLRNKMLVNQLGSFVMDGLVGNVAIPRQVGAATGYWFDSETNNITAESNPTVDQVSLIPKTCGAYTDISRRLLKQSTPAAEALVRNDLAAVLALMIDRAALVGTGAPQPTGIFASSGVSLTNWATANTPTWAELVGLETNVSLANALDGNFYYVSGSALRGACKTIEKVAGTAVFLADDNGDINGYKSAVTNQLAAGQMIFGNFGSLIIGMWGGIELQANPYINELAGGLRVTALADVDVAVRNPAFFACKRNTPST